MVQIHTGTDGRQFHRIFLHTAASQLASGHDGHSLGFAQPFVTAHPLFLSGLLVPYLHISGQFFERHAPQRLQTVVAIGHDTLHQAHGRLLHSARTDKDGQQFGIAQRRSPFLHHLLARAVVFGPLLDIQFRRLHTLIYRNSSRKPKTHPYRARTAATMHGEIPYHSPSVGQKKPPRPARRFSDCG